MHHLFLASLAIFITAAEACPAQQAALELFQPLALAPATEIYALTSLNSEKVGTLGRFYAIVKKTHGKCFIRLQGDQVIYCDHPHIEQAYKVRYDSVLKRITVTESAIDIKDDKEGAFIFSEDDLVNSLREYLKDCKIDQCEVSASGDEGSYPQIR
ncbi:MAG TPA: hypothetical protein VEZ24_13360 [Microvirga sp.]|nr:hypothetical protein [Microvirga sp.]